MDKLSLVKSRLADIFGFMHISPKVTVDEVEDAIRVFIEGDRLSFLIGYRGESLDALQTILALSLSKDLGEWSRVLVDINGYREQRIEKIEDITRGFIDRVRFFSKEVALPPMNSFERYRVHTFVSEYDDITSESIGEKRDRHVILKPVQKEVS